MIFRMPKIIYCLTFLVCLANGLIFYSSFATAHGKLAFYAPEITAIEGILERQTFPGPPNYESIFKGDTVERGWYLRLNQPIDVASSAFSSKLNDDELEKNVQIMQIVVMTNEQAKQLKNIPSGKRLTIRGTLFHQLTGHHHSRVLISVNNFSVEK